MYSQCRNDFNTVYLITFIDGFLTISYPMDSALAAMMWPAAQQIRRQKQRTNDRYQANERQPACQRARVIIVKHGAAIAHQSNRPAGKADVIKAPGGFGDEPDHQGVTKQRPRQDAQQI